MSPVALAYPHDFRSFEPSRMTAREIWRVGSEAREQLCRRAGDPRIDVADIASRSRKLLVNGVALETHWECGDDIHDNEGCAAFGFVQHEAGSDVALIALNPHLIGDRDELWRSTAAHELGHAIFDVPGWIKACVRHPSPTGDKRILLRRQQDGKWLNRGVVDWSEWRATEFMGGFLAPRRLLAMHLLRKAIELGLPLTMRHALGTPVLNAASSGLDGVEAMALELAELFGLSPSFVHTRLRKYRLLDPL